MRKGSTLLLLCLLTGSVLAEPPDSPGWNGTRWGQNSAQVQQLLADSAKPAEGKASEGLETRLEIATFELSGFPFRVELLFRPATDALQRVDLNYKTEPPVPKGREAATACARVEDLLVKKYGPATRNLKNGESIGGLMMTHRHWVLPTTTIRLLAADTLAVGGFCSITYEPTKSAELDKV
jgi:hypothetical protein